MDFLLIWNLSTRWKLYLLHVAQQFYVFWVLKAMITIVGYMVIHFIVESKFQLFCFDFKICHLYIQTSHLQACHQTDLHIRLSSLRKHGKNSSSKTSSFAKQILENRSQQNKIWKDQRSTYGSKSTLHRGLRRKIASEFQHSSCSSKFWLKQKQFKPKPKLSDEKTASLVP